MGYHLRLIPLLLAGALFFIGTATRAVALPAGHAQKILVINSYNYGYDWSDDELAGLKKTLLGDFPRLDLYVEYLDTKNFYRKRLFPRQAQLLQEKYADIPLDAVITLDNSALEFALTYRSRLFPKVPLVFCGVNNFVPAMIAGQDRITGIGESHDTVGTLALALRLQPATREVVVVHDYTDTGLAMRHELEAAAGRFPGLTLRYMPEAHLETTVEALRKLPADCIVLILSYTVEEGGSTFTQAETGRLISAASAVPVYAVHAEQLGSGVVGGRMLGGGAEGERAALLATRILKGEDPDTIPIQSLDRSRPMFDAQAMGRFGISRARLPEDAVLVNLPRNFYAVNKKAFWILMGIVSFLTVTLVLVWRNNLQRRRAERALRLERNNFQAIFEGVNDAILLHDSATGAILDVNARTEELYGYSREEIRQLTVGMLSADVAPYSQADAVAWLEKARQGASPIFEWRARHRDGHLFWVEITMRRAELSDCDAILVAARDIKERKRAEEEKSELENQLRQSEKMQAIGQLAGGIAHDFNNQLMGVLGYAEMLLLHLREEKPLGYAQNIKTLVQRSADLTQQLLNFGRKGKRVSKPVAVHAIIGEVVSLLKRSLDKRIRIRQLLQAGEDTVIGDPSQLQSALLNLAINARDAMPEGGDLLFETELLRLDETAGKFHRAGLEPGDYLCIRITDTGCGMDEEILSHIFEPFFTTKAVGKGTGMGLASVYGTVLSHHGCIDVYSEVGQGTTFRLCLPLAEVAAVREEQRGRRAPVTGTAHILVVDDEEAVREILGKMLMELGYRVTPYGDGRGAVEYYHANWQKIDLVILDMIMPEPDGWETYAALRRINPGLRAIFASGFPADDKAQPLIAAGVADCLRKPFELLELSEVVAKALQVEAS